MKKLFTSLLFLLLACGTVSAAAVTQNFLTSNEDLVDRTIYTTASISPASNQLILLITVSKDTNAAAAPTVTGNGLTWVEIASEIFSPLSGASRRVAIFRAMGASPSSGVVTITQPLEVELCQWSISEFANVDTGGANGADAVVQVVIGTPADTQASHLVTLASFSNADNATYGAVSIGGSPVSITPGTGFAEIDEVSNNGAIQTQWKDTNDTSVDWTFPTSAHVVGFAVEIKNATDVTQLLLEADDDPDNLSVYTTGSYTPSANKLILAFIGSGQLDDSTASPPSSVTGNGLTWVLVDNVNYVSPDRYNVAVFRAMGSSPSTGITTITYGQDQFSCGWIIVEFDNVDTGGENGADAVVQSATNAISATAMTVTLSAFSNTANATVSMAASQATQPFNQSAGWTEIADLAGIANANPAVQFIATNDTTAVSDNGDNSWAGGVALEIKNATQDIMATLLTKAVDLVDRTIYTTASIAPTGNELVLLWVHGKRDSTAAATPGIGGNGLTWVVVDSYVFGGNHRLSLFRAMGASPSSGIITITWENEQFESHWAVVEFSGIDTGGSDGADAIEQFVTANPAAGNPGKAPLITLAALQSAGSGVVGNWSNNSGEDFTAGSGFTFIDDGNDSHGIEFKLNDITVDATTVNDANHSGIAVELKIAPLSAGTSAGARGSRLGFNF